MSRCFPFPPPGYERKIKAVDELESLKKEKHKEKKHKKEKDRDKEKEKRENKEKQEKEKTDEKHREKKDKKEKHREKKKDKERDRDRDKERDRDRDKDRDRDRDKHKGQSLLNDEKRSTGAPDVHLNKSADKSKDKNDRFVNPPEKQVAGLSVHSNGQSFAKNNYLPPQTKGFNSLPEMGRRSIDEEGGVSNQLFDQIVAPGTKKEGVVKIGWNGAAVVADSKEKVKKKSALDGKMDSLRVSEEPRISRNTLGQISAEVKSAGNCTGPLLDGRQRKDKPAVDGRMDGQAVGRDSRSSGIALPPNSVGMVENRVGAVARPLEKKFEQKVEGTEKIREKEGRDRKGEKRKERDKQKPIQKDKDREKEKKKEEKVSEQKLVQMARIRDGNDNHLLTPTSKDDSKNVFPSPQSTGILDISKTSILGGDAPNTGLGKRKDIGLNGICDEHMPVPNKLARTAAPTPPLVENGRSLEACQNSAVTAPGVQRPPMNIKLERTFAPDDTQRLPMNIKVDGKERKINGITTAPFPQPQAAAILERKSDVPVKPPHPDTKYLGQILSVPKMDEWSEYDDQEWLMGGNGSQTKWPETQSSSVVETPEVWAKAVWLEPVDMFALPYVIPH